MKIEKLIKTYGMEGHAVTALKGISLTVKRGGSAHDIKVKLGTRPSQAPNG